MLVEMSRSGHVTVAKLLLDCGADVDKQDKVFNTMLSAGTTHVFFAK